MLDSGRFPGKLGQRWDKTHDNSDCRQFPHLMWYPCSSDSAPIVMIIRSFDKAVDQSIKTTALFRLKTRFPGWLWDKCDEALRIPDSGFDWVIQPYPSYCIKPQELEAALTLVIDNLPGGLDRYPPRPEHKLPTSLAVDAFRSVLNDAPMIGDNPAGVQKYLEEHSDEFTGETFYEWNRNMTFEALIAVFDEHGLGEACWKAAHWEVYDKAGLDFI